MVMSEVVMSEVKRLEEYLKELDEVTLRLIELSEETHADAFRQTLEEYEVIVVRAKQDAYKLLSSSSINSGASSRRTHVANVPPELRAMWSTG